MGLAGDGSGFVGLAADFVYCDRWGFPVIGFAGIDGFGW